MDINLVLGERINELELRWKKLTEKKETLRSDIQKIDAELYQCAGAYNELLDLRTKFVEGHENGDT